MDDEGHERPGSATLSAVTPSPPRLPEDLVGRAFRVEEARASGLTRRQLDGPAVRRVHRGVFVDAAEPDSLALRCAAALLAMPEGSVVSHHTAAELRGLPVPKSAAIHVTVPGRKAPVVGGVRAHLGAEGLAIETFGGLALTARPRLWLDLAAELGRVDLTCLGDAILRSGRIELRHLEAALEAAGPRRGVRLARAVLPLLETRVDSPQETRLRLVLIDGGLPRPVVNRPIFDADGEWVGEPDLQYPAERVPIEYEGEHHRTPEQQRSDIRRDEVYRDHGWASPVKVVSRDLDRPGLLVARVARQLELGRRRPAAPPNP